MEENEGKRIYPYMVDLACNSHHISAKELRARYHMDYGLALRGLQKHHEVDPIQYGKLGCMEAIDRSWVLETNHGYKRQGGGRQSSTRRHHEA